MNRYTIILDLLTSANSDLADGKQVQKSMDKGCRRTLYHPSVTSPHHPEQTHPSPL